MATINPILPQTGMLVPPAQPGNLAPPGPPPPAPPTPPSPQAQANIEARKATMETIEFIIYAQLAAIAIAFLISSPLIFRYFAQGRFKTGWVMRRNKIATGLETTVATNRAPTVPIGRSSSAAGTLFSKLNNSVFLRTIPFIGATIGQALIFFLFQGAVIFGMMHSNQNPAVNFKRPGWVATVFLPLLFLLAMKNTPFGILGKSYEKVNFIHRMIGQFIFFGSLIHGLLWVKGKLANNRPIVMQGAALTGTIAMAGLFLIAVTSISFFRFRFYEVFLVSHSLGYTLMLGALWFHKETLRPYIIFCALAIQLDFIMRFIKISVKSAVFTSLPGGLTQIEVDRLSDGWKAGQHVYLRVFNGFRTFEKHPFTIANAPARLAPSGRNTLVLIAKSTGSFTNSLHRVGYAEAALVGGDLEKTSSFLSNEILSAYSGAASESRLGVAVEGPYGSSLVDMCDYETVLLISGGSGFTYCMSTLEHIVGSASQDVGVTKTVYIIWTLRDLDIVQVFSNALNSTISRAQELQMQIIMRIHVTSEAIHTDLNPVPYAQVISGRADLPAIISEALERTTWSIDQRNEVRGCGIGVGACGPEGLVSAARAAVASANSSQETKAGGIKFYSEVFGL